MRAAERSPGWRRAEGGARLAAWLAAPVLALFVLLSTGCGGRHPVASATPQDQLRVAQARYDAHDYLEAIEILKSYVQNQSGAADVDRAIFLLGMSYVQRKEWVAAAAEFERLIAGYPDSERLPDAHYWLGVSYWRQARPAAYDQDATSRAIAQWERFLRLYPDHPRAADARRLLSEGRSRLAEKAVANGRLYLRLRKWTASRFYFELVRREYADTRWADDAILGLAEALRGENRPDEARRVLREGLAGIRNAEVRQDAERFLRRLEREGGGAK